MNVGKSRCFDDKGVILGDIIPVDDQFCLYYVGFQHVEKVKFRAFSGLAISSDRGKAFERYLQALVLDRTTTGRFGCCIHTVLHDNGISKCWYAMSPFYVLTSRERNIV